jgi:hypothetical protein
MVKVVEDSDPHRRKWNKDILASQLTGQVNSQGLERDLRKILPQ